MTTRKKKNETNQSVKSERHNFVSILGDNSSMCWKHFAVAVQAIYICIALMFAVFGGVMVGRSIWLTKQVKEQKK